MKCNLLFNFFFPTLLILINLLTMSGYNKRKIRIRPGTISCQDPCTQLLARRRRDNENSLPFTDAKRTLNLYRIR
jgi:hypothetical protein